MNMYCYGGSNRIAIVTINRIAIVIINRKAIITGHGGAPRRSRGGRSSGVNAIVIIAITVA